MSATKSQEASSSASPFSYDVFLSFRALDTRRTFTDHLYKALNQAGFHTFRDKDEIEVGEDIYSPKKVIRESRMSIIVLSKNYASSIWCLEELVTILECRTFGHIVLPVFYDVDPSEVRKQIGSFKEAFTRHEEKLELEIDELEKEKMKDKLRTWRIVLREVASLAGLVSQNQVDRLEARFIQKIIEAVEDNLSCTSLNSDSAPNLVGELQVNAVQSFNCHWPSFRNLVEVCISLVEFYESIRRLERLVYLDLEDCKSLRNLPSSIYMLKHLKELVLSGCSNQTVLLGDEIVVYQSLPTNGQVNAVQSSIWPWPRLRKLVGISPLFITGCSNQTALLADEIVVYQSLPTNGQVNATQSFIWPWPRLRKLVGISPLFSRAKSLHVWPGLNFWYYLAIISSPPWVFSFLAMDFIKKTTDLVFIFLISTLALSCFAINFMLSQFYFSLPSIPEIDRFFLGYQRAGKTIGYTLLFFGNVGLYYSAEKSVACMLTFLFLAFYCLCALFCIQPYTDFGALEFLLSACMNQTSSLFGLRSSYSWLVIIACIVIAGIRFCLEPAEATTDEVDLELGHRNT